MTEEKLEQLLKEERALLNTIAVCKDRLTEIDELLDIESIERICDKRKELFCKGDEEKCLKITY